MATARHFLQIEGLTREQLQKLLAVAKGNLAVADQRIARKDTLSGRVIANLFFEDSTRTRCSFETAVHRLGGEVFTLTATGSSASKGESLVDTALNIEAMGVSGLIIRSTISGGPAMVAKRVSIPVINAGDGRHEHPTQGLLDLLTLQESLGSLEGKRVAIVGDIANSRVARSATQGLAILGCQVVLIGPPTLVNKSHQEMTKYHNLITISHDLDANLRDLDAIMMLRLQVERAASYGVSSDYRTLYGLTSERALRLKGGAVVLHPGPVNRGVEIDDSVADEFGGTRILRQVTHGVAARMAVLEEVIRQ
ncbi:MAG: aspartate carbamoyltransferase catalytic subunit [Planctomycetes bacterium]|nr:aspartate carbamoyltransferase catalytic subunit [Planctomycetota bacterium]